MTLKVVSLQDKHLTDAAKLFCARYRTLRERVPALPARYAEVSTIRPMLRDLAAQAPGTAALRGGQLVGYFLGFVIPAFRGQRTAYSPEWANGAALADSRRIYEDMYTHLSARWVADRCFTHLIGALAHDRDGLAGWHWSGFGMIAADAVRSLEPAAGHPAEVTIRRADGRDIAQVVTLIDALRRHLAAAPTFLVSDEEDIRTTHARWLANPANAMWLAEEDARAVACMMIGPANPDACTIIGDEATASIVGAFTEERARGRGIATALLNRALDWARAAGYGRCAVDFEPMNVLAARFWTRHFAPISYALVRHVDERIGIE
jgi:GNAT superfamily N-acetyltransferase